MYGIIALRKRRVIWKHRSLQTMKRTGLKGRTHLEKSKLYDRRETGDELSAKLNVLGCKYGREYKCK